jgi:son of sevenless-like protein
LAPASPIGETTANTILDLDGQLFGRVLAIKEQGLFKSIKLSEFYCQGWNDKKSTKCKNLQKLIAWFNQVAAGMATEILRHEDVSVRVDVIKKLIAMAEECLHKFNYNTCFEIVAGLNMASISRLKKTWKALPKKSMESWESLNRIVSNESIFSRLLTF